jgi:hypothetical protein
METFPQKKEEKKTQLLLILYDNKSDLPLNLKELADLDHREGYLREDRHYVHPTSSVMHITKTHDEHILLYSYFETNHDLEKFKEKIQSKLTKKYGNRFSIEQGYNLILEVKSSRSEHFDFLLRLISDHRDNGF